MALKGVTRVAFQKGKMKAPRYATVLNESGDKQEVQVKLGHNGFICWIPVSCILRRYPADSHRHTPKPKSVFLPPIILEGAADRLLKQIRREPILMPKRRKLIDNRKVRTQHIWKLLLALSRLEKIPPSSWNSLTNVDLDHIAGIFRQRGFVKLAYVGRPLFRRYKRVWIALGSERRRRDPEFNGKMNALRKGRPSRWEQVRGNRPSRLQQPCLEGRRNHSWGLDNKCKFCEAIRVDGAQRMAEYRQRQSNESSDSV